MQTESVEDICYEVVAEIAGRTRTDPLELDPLTTAVDPDALVALLDGPSDVLTVSFRYEGFEVTAHGSGAVELERVEAVSRAESPSGRVPTSTTD